MKMEKKISTEPMGKRTPTGVGEEKFASGPDGAKSRVGKINNINNYLITYFCSQRRARATVDERRHDAQI